ncbi:MAG: tRNA pseudouridine(38-40) synthase TruA [Cellulosilyticaceae bacterium]
MRNIKLIIQYDGSRYKGWQRQEDNDLTIQGKLEAVLTKMAEEPIEVIGAERTDVGVHAENYVANFKTECTLSIVLIQDYLYTFLPEDIVVKAVEEVDERFHARYNVKSKTYVYTINNGAQRDVFNRKYTYHLEEKLDETKMKEVAKVLEGKHDFQSFTSVKAGSKSTVRDLKKVHVTRDGDTVKITLEANDFLWHMPRFIVGVLLEVGKGELSVAEVKRRLEEEKKGEAQCLAKPKALCLESVKY